MSEKLIAPFEEVGYANGIGRVLRPKGWMENPYIGKDGKDYRSLSALRQADKVYYDARMSPKPLKKII